MTFKSANRLGFIFKTSKGEVKFKLNDNIRVTTYLREFVGELVSVHFESGHKNVTMVGDKRQLLQIAFADIIELEVL